MSINSSTEPSIPNHSSTIVSQIRDLLPLPKHAIFHVKLVIHQLQSVPLVSGEFKIKWKFRHLQAVNRAGRPLGLGRALVLKLDGQKKKRVEFNDASDSGKGKGKEVVYERDEDDLQELDISSFPLPTFLDGLPHSTRVDRPPSKQSTSSSNSTSISASKSTFHFHSSLDPSKSEDLGIDYRIQAKGNTPYLPLRDFKVEFDSEINAAVQLSIEKDTMALQASELKLTIMQRVIPNDPESPVNPRLGHVEVNLAEYVNAGPVTRTYLLRRSKVNAMLNMTITMTQISGEERYRAPPLRKEEIKAGISDFLGASKVPLPSLSRYIPVDDPWLSSSLGQFVKLDEDGLLVPEVDEPEDSAEPSPEIPNQQPRRRKRWRVGARTRSSSSQSKAPNDPAVSSTPKIVDPSRQKQRLHPTEALIEAIFNPYPCTSDMASPFTYFVPRPPTPKPEPRKHDSVASEGNGTDGTSRGSFDSSLRTSASASASDQGHEGEKYGGSMSGYKWWRRKTGSRPVTPSPTDSRRH